MATGTPANGYLRSCFLGVAWTRCRSPRTIGSIPVAKALVHYRESIAKYPNIKLAGEGPGQPDTDPDTTPGTLATPQGQVMLSLEPLRCIARALSVVVIASATALVSPNARADQRGVPF